MVGGDRRSPPPKEGGSDFGGGGSKSGGKHRSGSTKRDRPKPAGGSSAAANSSVSKLGGGLGDGSGGSGGPNSGIAGSIKSAQGGTTVVYTKSPAKRTETAGGDGVFRFGVLQDDSSGVSHGRGGLPMPTAVKNLLDQFGEGPIGDQIRAVWANTVLPAKEVGMVRNNSVGGSLRTSPALKESPAIAGAEKVAEHPGMDLVQKGGQDNTHCMEVELAQDLAMHELHGGVHRTEGARQNAQLPCTLNSEEFSRKKCLDSGGQGVNPSWVDCKAATHTSWADEMDAQMEEEAEAAMRTSGARGFAPTITDVSYSLDRVGFQQSFVDSFCDKERDTSRTGRAIEMEEDPRRPSLAKQTAQPKPAANLGEKQKAHSAWQKPAPVRVTQILSRKDVCGDGVAVDLNHTAVNRNLEKLDRALVCSLLGRRFPYNFLTGELKRRWAHFGDFEIIMTGPDHFTCVCSSTEIRDAILLGGPWFIAGQVLGMDKWSSDLDPNSLQGLSAPVWVRLPHLPLPYWDNDNIVRIAAMLGQPLWVDAHTDRWGRSSYARVCIRLDLSQRLVPGVWINGIKGRVYQAVEYEGISFVCFHCGLVGHKETSCPKLPSKAAGDPSTSSRPPSSSSRPPRSSRPAASPISDTGERNRPLNPPVSNSPNPVHGSDPTTAVHRSEVLSRQIHESGTHASSIRDEGTSHVPCMDLHGEHATNEEEKRLGPWIFVQRRRRPAPSSAVKRGQPLGSGSLDRKVNAKPPAKPPASISISQDGRLSRGKAMDDGHAEECSTSGLDAGYAPFSSIIDQGTSSSQALILHKPSSALRGTGIRERSTKVAMGKELLRLGPPPNLPKKRRKNSTELTDGGDASPSVDQ